METVLISIALLWLVAAVTPGPNFFVLTRVALTEGRTAAFAAVLGVATGTILWGITGFYGIGFLFLAAPWLFIALKTVGGCYLMYLGLRWMRAAWRRSALPQGEIIRLTPAKAFRLGLVTNLSNPKTGALVASLFAATLPAEPDLALGIEAVAIMFTVSITWYGIVVWTFGHEGPRRLYRRAQRGIDLLAGGIFIAFGAKLIADR